MKKIFNLKSLPALLLGSVSLVAASAALAWHHNPIDKISNPEKLEFTDVQVGWPDFAEPFVRDGIVSKPEGFRQVQAGLTAGQIQSMLGQPLKQAQGSRGLEWDYNFKFLMPQSQNYLVCQYKVVFEGDQAEKVREAVWRRHQCLDLVQPKS